MRVLVSDITGPGGVMVPASAVEWFAVGRVRRKPYPGYMTRRELPSGQVRWVPDILVPVESFVVDEDRPQAVWVEVGVPHDAAVGEYRGAVTVEAKGIEPQRVPFVLEVQGFTGRYRPEDLLDIGSDKQLFIDDYIIGESRGCRLVHHAFKKHPANPLIVPDRPTEGILLFLYGTVLKDTGGPGFRMWHGSYVFHGGEWREHVLYAESDDGLAWCKPDLGIFEYAGSRANNLVDVGTEWHFLGPSVIYRPDDPNPDRRYVRYYQSPNVTGTCAAYSADGIHWEHTDVPLFLGSDAACPTYDPRTGRFHVVTVEDRVIGAYVRRSPAFSTSDDGRRWSEFRPALWADAWDDRNAVRNLARSRPVLSYDYPNHHHSEFNDVRPYPYAGLYLASVTMFECCAADIYKGTPGGRGSGKDDCSTHVQLASSRSPDLSEWRRAANRQPVLDRGMPGEWDSGFMSTADAPVVVGDELWLYYGGMANSQQHQSCQVNTNAVMRQGEIKTGIGLASMRLDGFMSLDAGVDGGSLVTKVLVFAGDRLEVNAAVRGGLRVEFLDEAGGEIPGFSADDCRLVTGDSVRHDIRFGNGRSLREVSGRPVRVRFDIRDTQLYAFQFMG